MKQIDECNNSAGGSLALSKVVLDFTPAHESEILSMYLARTDVTMKLSDGSCEISFIGIPCEDLVKGVKFNISIAPQKE